MEGEERVRKLKWLCRRGMKELDILLERFVDQNLQPLACGTWPEFESLLQTEDDVLWGWFLDSAVPGAAPYRDLLDQIRRARD